MGYQQSSHCEIACAERCKNSVSLLLPKYSNEADIVTFVATKLIFICHINICASDLSFLALSISIYLSINLLHINLQLGYYAQVQVSILVCLIVNKNQ